MGYNVVYVYVDDDDGISTDFSSSTSLFSTGFSSFTSLFSSFTSLFSTGFSSFTSLFSTGCHLSLRCSLHLHPSSLLSLPLTEAQAVMLALYLLHLPLLLLWLL